MSPLLWILHINRLSTQIRAPLERVVPYKRTKWDFIIQIFADDVSAAVAHEKRKAAIHIAWLLKDAILTNFGDLHLEIAIRKCNNFLMEKGTDKMVQNQRRSTRPLNRSLKEQKRKRMSRDLDKIVAETEEGGEKADLPFQWSYCYRLLGVILDCHWAFEEHLKVLKTKAERRQAILRRVSNTRWGLETRILSITTHSLVESVVSYGLATYGAHILEQDARAVDTRVLNRAARRVVGTGPTIRREIMHVIADTRSFHNHHILKGANILDRVLRAKGTTAQRNADQYLNKHYYNYTTHQQKEGGVPQYWSILNKTKLNRKEWYSGGYLKHPLLEEVSWIVRQCNYETKSADQETLSIYRAQDELSREDPQAEELQFASDKKGLAYETALLALRAIEWTPAVIFDSDPFPPRKEIQIIWEKITWSTVVADNEVTEGEKNAAAVGAKEVAFSSIAASHSMYVVCLTIRSHENTLIKSWANIMGKKLTEDPRHTGAECLTASLMHVWECIKQELLPKDTKVKWNIIIKNEYTGGLHKPQIDRWNQYHATFNPPPNQARLNAVLHNLTNCPNVSSIEFRPYLSNKKQRQAIESESSIHLRTLQ